MARKEIKGPITDNTLNALNHNLIELYNMRNVLQTQINDLVLDAGKSDQEVAQARGGHQVLADRLNETDSQLAENEREFRKTLKSLESQVNTLDHKKTSKSYVNSKFNEANNRIDNIIATPTNISSEEIIDARDNEPSLGNNIRKIKQEVENINNIADIFMTQKTDDLPNLDTRNWLLTFPDTFVIGTKFTNYTIPGGATIDMSSVIIDSASIRIYYDPEENEFHTIRNMNTSDGLRMVGTFWILLAIVKRFDSGKSDMLMNTSFTIDNYIFDEELIANFPMVMLTDKSPYLPNIDTNNHLLTIPDTFFIALHRKRYTVTGGVEIDFSDVREEYSGIRVYYDPIINEFHCLGDSVDELSKVKLQWIPFCFIKYRRDTNSSYAHIGCPYTINNETPFITNKNYRFTTESPIGLIKSYYLPGVGENESDFDFDNDDHELVYGLFDDLKNAYPDYIKKNEITKSSNGKGVFVYEFTPNQPINRDYSLPTISLGAAIHGGENLSVDVLYYFLKTLCEEWENDSLLEYLRFNVSFSVIPLQNPDDYDTKEYNGESNTKINLNRDWDFKWEKDKNTGEAPFERVESRAIRDYLLQNKGNIIHHIDCHTRGGGYNFNKVNDSSMAELISNGEESHRVIWSNSLVELKKKWSNQYKQLPNEEFFGRLAVSNGAKTARGYIHNIIGIPTVTWEAFSMSTTMDKQENSDVVSMNFDVLTQLITDIVKYYKK